jgi:hypothetical protein
MKPVEPTRQELAKILEDFVKGSGTRWEWDDFLSSQIADENLERIRLRCSSLDTEFPPVQNGHFCSEEGLRLIKGYIVELRSTRNIGVR